jgi:multiple sugar transport system substrate-binding protein
MQIMKRALYGLWVLWFMVIIGCSRGDRNTTSPETEGSTMSSIPYKLYFYNWTNEDNMVPLLEGFNKEYVGKYEMVYQKMTAGSSSAVNTALASGERIDVMTQSSAFDLRSHANSGIYLGLKQFLQKEGKTYLDIFGKSIEETMNIDGDYYAMPYSSAISVVYFNKKMFDEANVPYPKPDWTWADFKETAKKLTKGSGANKVYGAMINIAPNTSNIQYWGLIAQQNLVASGIITLILNQLVLIRLKWKKAFDFFMT